MKKKIKLFAILLSLQTAFVSAESIRDFESLNLKLRDTWDAAGTDTASQGLSPKGTVPNSRDAVSVPQAKNQDNWKKDWLLHALAGTQVALQAADVVTTRIALDRGAEEGNPLMKKIVGSWPLMIAVKAAVTGGVLLVAYGARREGHKRLPKFALAGLNAFYAGIVVNNVLVINRL